MGSSRMPYRPVFLAHGGYTPFPRSLGLGEAGTDNAFHVTGCIFLAQTRVFQVNRGLKTGCTLGNYSISYIIKQTIKTQSTGELLIL